MTSTINYELASPNPYDTGDTAGTKMGTWEAIPMSEVATIEEARADAAVLQAEHGYGRIAIYRLTDGNQGRWPEEIVEANEA